MLRSSCRKLVMAAKNILGDKQGMTSYKAGSQGCLSSDRVVSALRTLQLIPQAPALSKLPL